MQAQTIVINPLEYLGSGESSDSVRDDFNKTKKEIRDYNIARQRLSRKHSCFKCYKFPRKCNPFQGCTNDVL